MALPIKHSVETTWINSWVEAGYTIHVSSSASFQMKVSEVDLADINYVLRTGRVVESDVTECDGFIRGLWNVDGKTVDDDFLRVTVSVDSTEYDVELIEIVKLRKTRVRNIK
jgi:hypothetical protein